MGDEDQRIYAWRGAAADVMSSFVSDFHGRTYTLEPNFRCTQVTCVRVGLCLRRNCVHRLQARLTTCGELRSLLRQRSE